MMDYKSLSSCVSISGIFSIFGSGIWNFPFLDLEFWNLDPPDPPPHTRFFWIRDPPSRDFRGGDRGYGMYKNGIALK